jgi:hypothetical protein
MPRRDTKARRWLCTLGATAVSTYALDATATAGGGLLAASQLVRGLDRSWLLVLLAASYVATKLVKEVPYWAGAFGAALAVGGLTTQTRWSSCAGPTSRPRPTSTASRGSRGRCSGAGRAGRASPRAEAFAG